MKTNSEEFVMEAETPWQKAGEGVVRQIMGYDEQLMLVKLKFETGATGLEHSHPHSQTSYVVSGVFEYFIEGRKQILKPGDCAYVAPNLKHYTRCLEEGILLDFFSPCRKDFL